MFKRQQPDGHLDREIKRTLFKMNAHEPDSNEYAQLLERLQKLKKLQADTKPASVSPDTILTTAAYLFGMLMIVHHEHVGAVTTKAMSLLPRPR